jgi:KDO2-lipid IV(A) lauroyltransferase
MRDRAVTAAYRGSARVAAHVPPRPAAALGAGLGRVVAVVSPARRRLVARHQARATGRPPTRRELANCFASYGRYWVETFQLPSWTRADLDGRFRADGMEHLAAATAGGRGAIFALPHLGSWEVAGRWVSGQGYRLTVVVEPLEPPELFAWFIGLRRAMGLEVVPLGPDVPARARDALADGRVLCLVADRDLTGTGVEVEFLGERTRLPAGPALMALRHDVEILPVGTYTEPRGRHHSVIHPAIDRARRGRLADDVARITQDLARAFEDIIRREPSQWHLQQPNWPSDLGERSAPGR